MDVPEDTTKFRRPNESCLERFRAEIAEKRQLGWSYRAINRWLADKHGYQMNWGTVRKFCLVRKIEKHVGETPERVVLKVPATDYLAPPEEPLVRRRQHRGKVFEYDDSGPLITRRTKPNQASGGSAEPSTET
ncbi:hypothetical protein OAV21_01640 [bacterium]|jgi:hypothetical protein|nr:hypothetical protein [bacterium]MDF1787310.1 hypothetical protein [Verrucomicrobiales bacterium]